MKTQDCPTIATPAPSFLALPVEIRLSIYTLHLCQQQHIVRDRQPTNAHLRLLRTCRQIRAEAGPVMWSYISLSHEGQINKFIDNAPEHRLARVRWVDVANDGRLLKIGDKDKDVVPLSRLHLALRKLPSVAHMRVFECFRGIPVSLHSLRSTHFVLAFEDAMLFSLSSRPLLSYELQLGSSTRAILFRKVSPSSLTTLRLSGECHLPTEMSTPCLKRLVIKNVTGNYFDQASFEQCFRGADLESFSYALGDRIAFEIRDRHLASLAHELGRSLRKLVLLCCSRLSSAALDDCLGSLSQLQYLALSITTVEEQRVNFVLSVPNSVAVFKLHVINAWYAAPLLAEERRMCDAIEAHVLCRNPPPESVALHFRPLLTQTEGRQNVWEGLARRSNIRMYVGPWEDEEEL